MDSVRLFTLVLLVAGATQIIGKEEGKASQNETASPISTIKGRLLTPQEGCGISKVVNPRIVGEQDAKMGAWPWIALLGYRKSRVKGISFKCGGSLITSRHEHKHHTDN